MRTRFVPLILLLALVPLASCGKDDDRKEASTADEASTTITTDATTTTTSKVPATEPGVSVHATGLVVQHEDGSRDELFFPTPEQAAVDLLASVLGPPTQEGPSEGCGGSDYFVGWLGAPHDLGLEIADDQLVGWNLRDESDVKTETGIGIGSTKAELEEAYGPVEIDETSTLGHEFSTSDGIGGTLTEDTPTGEIDSLWAGITCFFR